MRVTIIGVLLFVLPCAGWSQETGTAFLARLPSTPGNPCRPAPEEVENFNKELNAMAREIDQALSKREKEQKAYVKEHEAQWRDQMMRQSGLSPDQIEKLKAASKSKDRKVRAAAKRELAEQALQQYADLTIDEAKNLKTMSEEERKNWKEAYASQQIAQAQARAQARTPEEQAEDEKKRERLAKLAALADEQRLLLEQIGAARDVIWEKLRQLESDAQDDREERIAPIEKRLADLKAEIQRLGEQKQRELERYRKPGGESLSHEEAIAVEEILKSYGEKFDQLYARRDAIDRELTEALELRCAKFSPTHCGLIREYVDWAKGAQPGFARYEELENEKFPLQMDAPNMQIMPVPGTLGIREAKACVDLLRSYDTYSREYLNRRTEPSEAAQAGAE